MHVRYLLSVCLALGSGLACSPGVPKPSSGDPKPAIASAYPIAVDINKVGTYPGFTKSGAGYFYDDVLEYRVWINPPEGGDDYYKAFPTFEEGLAYSKSTLGAEEPLVLVLQREWIDEPQPGNYVRKNGERLTEWKVDWLEGSKRSAEAIDRFLAEHQRPKKRLQLTAR